MSRSTFSLGETKLPFAACSQSAPNCYTPIPPPGKPERGRPLWRVLSHGLNESKLTLPECLPPADGDSRRSSCPESENFTFDSFTAKYPLNKFSFNLRPKLHTNWQKDDAIQPFHAQPPDPQWLQPFPKTNENICVLNPPPLKRHR